MSSEQTANSLQRTQTMNSITRAEENARGAESASRLVAVVTWLAVILVGLFCSMDKTDGIYVTIWAQNTVHPTPFSLNPIITQIYWFVLLVLQGVYLWHLFTSDADLARVAIEVSGLFVVNNIIQVAFILLWVNSKFLIAELLLVLNLLNLTALYLFHRHDPPWIHVPVISGPLSWTWIAILWNGAVMVNAHNLAARVAANIFVWSILSFGLVFLLVFQDYGVGFELSILAASLGVHQLHIKLVALQWIFAFTTMGVLFIASVAMAVGVMLGREGRFIYNVERVHEDGERQPLLDDDE